MMQNKLNNKLIVEDWLEKVADVEPEDFLPPIADVVFSEMVNQEH